MDDSNKGEYQRSRGGFRMRDRSNNSRNMEGVRDRSNSSRNMRRSSTLPSMKVRSRAELFPGFGLGPLDNLINHVSRGGERVSTVPDGEERTASYPRMFDSRALPYQERRFVVMRSPAFMESDL